MERRVWRSASVSLESIQLIEQLHSERRQRILGFWKLCLSTFVQQPEPNQISKESVENFVREFRVLAHQFARLSYPCPNLQEHGDGPLAAVREHPSQARVG